MEEKQYISRIKLANGNIVDVKDQEARSNLIAVAALVQENSDKFAALNTSVDSNIKDISTIQSALSAIVQPKSSDEISVETDGALGINEMNVNKLVQTEGDTFIIDGGVAVY